MNVKLISYTPNALELLLYTKNTRLQGELTLEDISAKPEEWKLDQLAYMKDTIKSSWEFVDYTFEINDVSRAFTHQFVRTRNGSYAQESHRSGDLSEHEWVTPEGYDDEITGEYEIAMISSFGAYKELIDGGMQRQDARGVIPTNVKTNIIAKFNLRTLHQMAEVRLCTRTQGEYQTVFRNMRGAVAAVHPWAWDFLQVFCANHGTCCFPRYTECPIQRLTYNVNPSHEHFKSEIKLASNDITHVANPVAKNGSTM